MQSLKTISPLIVKLALKTPIFTYSGSAWKERDEAAEKVYINQAEKSSMKKLLKKVEEDDHERLHDNHEFENELREILKRHDVKSDAFFSEISNLHKILSK